MPRPSAAGNLWRESVREPLHRATLRLWHALPEPVQMCAPVDALAHRAFARSRRQRRTPEATYTRFLRNRPLLETIADVLIDEVRTRPLRIAVLGCSTGAELYSLVYALRLRDPRAAIDAVGIDIVQAVVDQAASGHYRADGQEVAFLAPGERDGLLVAREGELVVVEGLREGVSWSVGDAGDASMRALLGERHVVLANNFIVHLEPPSAEACLRNVVSIVVHGGYVSLWGVDLDLRERLATELGLSPIEQRIHEIHDADVRARYVWPLVYWGLEPFDARRPGWQRRYAVLYRVP